jgi:Holliday junction DNA helicase RuvA
MIGYLKGHVVASGIVLDTSGVGWEVKCARELTLGEDVALFILTDVREDSITLYGFADVQEKETFALLRKTPGAGPAIALAAMSALGARGVLAALARGDSAALTKVKGIGARLAEKLVTFTTVPAHLLAYCEQGEELASVDPLLAALTSLGISPERAPELLRRARVDHSEEGAVLRSAVRSAVSGD